MCASWVAGSPLRLLVKHSFASLLHRNSTDLGSFGGGFTAESVGAAAVDWIHPRAPSMQMVPTLGPKVYK